MVINCNGLYLLHHGNNQIYVNMIASPIKIINTCKIFANYQFKSAMVVLCLDLWYSSILTWHSCAPNSHVFVDIHVCVTCKLPECHFTLDQFGTPMHKNNASTFSKCPCHKRQQEPQDVSWYKSLYNMRALLIMDSMIIHWTIPKW